MPWTHRCHFRGSSSKNTSTRRPMCRLKFNSPASHAPSSPAPITATLRHASPGDVPPLRGDRRSRAKRSDRRHPLTIRTVSARWIRITLRGGPHWPPLSRQKANCRSAAVARPGRHLPGLLFSEVADEAGQAPAAHQAKNLRHEHQGSVFPCPRALILRDRKIESQEIGEPQAEGQHPHVPGGYHEPIGAHGLQKNARVRPQGCLAGILQVQFTFSGHAIPKVESSGSDAPASRSSSFRNRTVARSVIPGLYRSISRCASV